jgi:hypothetical protein
LSAFDAMLEQTLAPQIDATFAVATILSRAGSNSDPFNAPWQRLEYEVADDQGFLNRLSTREFILPMANCVIDGQTIEPRAGDQLAITENGTQLTFEILPIGKLPACERMPGGYRWRVRTKQVP